ncbi:Sodium/nucleoside cotransporter 1 [Fulvia fulva]|uniref:Sodium/nucleoside cotransporter 1 n=1 Tax=Passalora fulva TaxID=5499 RepID=A0A9Q8PFS7_PASFU|nr:Sodium/nucleoside cotransporter 1 [Fulvia fulva]KAK4613993.1 Sodium/nucleoside cotransporter 1 [Fulvia fulva]KAK4614801.1 Sodium/nucleoside cotransporter 1 [Fulvia fulva]UJO21675.1 Sodium/nucleoside cotransporter 1 [Fulvia fulva]WPV20494.1 Sodium/nucleoside cotransporter 1 [Fulvia fulva]WPV34981.1 Sodium/nucleoside cotransporter 1 [Fulvia fulva]
MATAPTVGDDLALHPSHQHTHRHLHHSSRISHDGNDKPVYTVGNPGEPTIHPDPSPNDHDRSKHHGHDIEKKGEYEVNDLEKGHTAAISPSSSLDDDPHHSSPNGRTFYRKYRIYIHILLWLIATAWWVASLVLHRDDKNWVVPFLIYLAITLRIITLHTGTSYVTKPMRWTWRQTGTRVNNMIPAKARLWVGAGVTLAVIIVGSFVSEESADNTRENRAISLFGLVVLIFGLWATSRNRKAINWHTVISGMLIQYIIALFVLRTGAGYDIFAFISSLARSLLGFAKDGVAFLTTAEIAAYTFFFFSVLPAIIFFVALVQLLYYIGLIQWFIGKFAVFFFWSMRISGAESVVAAATPFIGQGESAMLIKPFVNHLTMCELHQVMCSGFATIAGSVLVAYIGLGVNPQALISSCVMSIPASLAVSKLRYPEEEESLTAGKVVIPDDDEHKSANALQAFANGAWLGLKIAGMILCTLLCIIAFVALINGLLTWFGRYINLDGDYDLTLELILSYVFYPVAFLLGVPRGPDLLKVARLIGTKVITNEFVAYDALVSDPQYATMSPRATLIATYALCGFGNIGSLGTQIGVLTTIAPGRSADVSRLAISALITGVLATLSSASIAGLVIQDQAKFITT